MNRIMTLRRAGALAIAVLFAVGALALAAPAQDRLKTYPGYDNYQKMSKEMQGAFKSGALQVTWKDGGKSFEYARDGKTWHYDIAAKKLTEVAGAAAPEQGGMRGGMRGGQGGPARGRQFGEALSPDKKIKAFYRDRNVWLSDPDGKNEVAVTTEGNEKGRIKYGTASWVYGEELAQTTAMWWSPDSTKLAYYRFDESKVPDYILQMDQLKQYTKADIEAYPKAGEPNPIAEIYVYDVAARKTTQIDVRDGKPFDNAVLGHYVYHVAWSPNGKELLFNRTNRRQNILEFCAADPAAGKVRAILREEWPTGWVENSPALTWFKDNNRFIWTSERSGFHNFYLYDLTGKLLVQLTNHPFEVERIVKLDEEAGVLWYMARDGANYMMSQLHRVKLNGKDDVRLTDPAYNHQVNLSPDGKFFVDVAQTHDVPPFTRLVDAKGKVAADLAKSDMTKFDQLGLKKAELFKYKAADGSTDLYGMLNFPSNFDPNKKYPLLVSVYAGPATNGARETFGMPSPLTEYGFLVASLDSRSAAQKGKKALDAIYLKLGIVEMDDQAAGVKALWERPYLNKERVGIFGTSYGGYSSAMCLLRYPDVFAAACAQSAVTSWNQYDSIYTERYMWIPQENVEGYENAKAMKYVDNLKGRLMIYYGTADNNVHPTNAMQLIGALQKAGKSFEVQVGPDMGHTAVNQQRMMEFFIENLVQR